MTPSADRADTQASDRSGPLWFWILAPVALMILIASCVVGWQKLVQYQQEAAEQKRKEVAREERERAGADDQKYGKEDDAKGFAWDDVRSRVVKWGDHLRWSEPQAKLDRETGRWTVTGTLERNETDLESDWQVVFYYTPADGLWHVVSEEPPWKFHPKASKDNGAAK